MNNKIKKENQLRKNLKHKYKPSLTDRLPIQVWLINMTQSLLYSFYCFELAPSSFLLLEKKTTMEPHRNQKTAKQSIKVNYQHLNNNTQQIPSNEKRKQQESHEKMRQQPLFSHTDVVGQQYLTCSSRIKLFELHQFILIHIYKIPGNARFHD